MPITQDRMINLIDITKTVTQKYLIKQRIFQRISAEWSESGYQKLLQTGISEEGIAQVREMLDGMFHVMEEEMLTNEQAMAFGREQEHFKIYESRNRTQSTYTKRSRARKKVQHTQTYENQTELEDAIRINEAFAKVDQITSDETNDSETIDVDLEPETTSEPIPQIPDNLPSDPELACKMLYPEYNTPLDDPRAQYERDRDIRLKVRDMLATRPRKSPFAKKPDGETS